VIESRLKWALWNFDSVTRVQLGNANRDKCDDLCFKSEGNYIRFNSLPTTDT
jgi:hypothetical protein